MIKYTIPKSVEVTRSKIHVRLFVCPEVTQQYQDINVGFMHILSKRLIYHKNHFNPLYHVYGQGFSRSSGRIFGRFSLLISGKRILIHIDIIICLGIKLTAVITACKGKSLHQCIY